MMNILLESTPLNELLDVDMSYDEILIKLKNETDNFSIDSGTINFDDFYDSQVAKSILENHYNSVEEAGIDDEDVDNTAYALDFSDKIDTSTLYYYTDDLDNQQIKESLLKEGDIVDFIGAEDDILDYCEYVLRDFDIDIDEIWLHGSRIRGNAREDSDLDAVMFYYGREKEDNLFNALHEEPFEWDGIEVDINPINIRSEADKEAYKQRSRQYDNEVLNSLNGGSK